MNIIPICEYINLMNIIPIHKYFLSIHEYLILILNIFEKCENISLWLCLPGKFFKWKINKSQEKEMFRHFFWDKIDIRYSWIIRDYFLSDEYYFYSYSHVLEFTNYSCLFVQKLALRNNSFPIRRKNYYSLITVASRGTPWLWRTIYVQFSALQRSLEQTV